MKLFIKKVLLLAILLGLVILGLNFLGIKAGKIYKDGAALVCESKREMVRSGSVRYEKGKINVLFMGTSRILAGIKPALFDRLSGEETFSYNLALPALPISSAYFILRDYLATNPPPEYIIMQLHIDNCMVCTLVNYYASQGLNRLGEVLSLFRNSPGKGVILNYFFPFRMYKFFISRYIYNGIFHPARLKQLQETNRVILNRMKTERGYYYIEEQAIAPEDLSSVGFADPGADVTPGKRAEFDPFIDPFVAEFFNLTRDMGTRVLLIQPVYRVNQCLQNEKIPSQFRLILERYDHVAIAAAGWKLRFYESKYFSDRTHLNREGADRYTGEIYREFRAAFIENNPAERPGRSEKTMPEKKTKNGAKP